MEVNEHLIEIKEEIVEIKFDLREHMRRTDVLEKLHMDNQVRLVKLEEPVKAREYLTNVIISVGKILGVALTVVAILRVLK